MSVQIGEMGTRGDIDIKRERAGPLDHPVHRDAVEQGFASPRMKGCGARVPVDEVGLLPLHQDGKAGPIKGLHDGSPMRSLAHR